ncbi:hypothetical protein PLICRDRAFT_116706 [Plicaturopsis crispa FD-325 SS-3]|uniref:HD/PDEase domain-containing protein n=1 Tax=Plicaturopsis crispa FD-325 SS-3 TaxID=944288 RepID=A0A0C9SLA6_PLICR|nr:hypothetical protein PLICRDRAFT_116706 [Plicaturopsis crispa FD-325 SS-3]
MAYPTAEESAAIKAAEQLMIETMARYDPSHDAFHVQRVRRTALSIARALPTQPDLLTVEIAALLHDVLDKKYVSAAQAADAYAFFLPFFRGLPVDIVSDGRAAQIARIVENVSWTTEKKLRETGAWGPWHETCVELHCVQDADRLDAIGAFGVLRCAAYSTAVNRPLHAPPDDPARKDTSIQHFYDKLLHIKDRLKTAPGKALGEKRHKLLLEFLASVEDEYNAVI